MAKNKLRPAKRTGEELSTSERILNYLLLDEEAAENYLTPHEEQVLERYTSISSLSARGYPTDKIIRIHMKKHQVSRATAFRDLKNALEVFGEAHQVSRQAKRYAVEQIVKRGLRMAEKAGDAKAHASHTRNLILIDRLDKDDTGAVDPTQIQPPALLLQLNVAGGKAARFDINKLSAIKDIDYVDIVETYAEEQSSLQQMEKYLDELEQERE